MNDMKYCYLDLYSDFACLAEKCPSTCCAGWQIAVDQESLEHFRELQDPRLRKDILGHIRQRKDAYYFKNRPDGRCAMLDEDGLCRIQRQTDEHTLCITCRKFPRLAGRVESELWMSMAASCPVVAEYLWRQRVGWFRVENEKAYPVELREIEVLQAVLREWESKYGMVFAENQKQPEEQWKINRKKYSAGEIAQELEEEPLLLRIRSVWKRYQSFVELAAGCLKLFNGSGELKYLEGSFDYFEQEERRALSVFEDIVCFEQVWQERLRSFYANYFPYRIYSRILEYPEEPEEIRSRQIFGEAALFYVIHFSRYYTLPELSKQQVFQEINWMYRFCAHGRVRGGGFRKLLQESFPELRDLVRIFWAAEREWE